MANATWTRRHILALADFTPDEYNTVLQTAASFREVLSRRTKKVPALQGHVVANLFFEPSTRTRSSFELAAKRLSADILNFAPGTSSLSKGETILDTAKTYLAMGTNMMVIRHRQAGVPQIIATEMNRLGVQVSVLNAGDGQHEHPSQGLLDLFTICSCLDWDNPRIELLAGKKITIVGDILHSRVARSNIWSLLATGAEVHLAGPPTLLPQLFAEYSSTRLQQPREKQQQQLSAKSSLGHQRHYTETPVIVEATVPITSQASHSLTTTQQLPISHPKLYVHWDIEPALKDADFVMTLRLQKERMTSHLLPSLREYHQRYGITQERLQLCQPNVHILHPGPVNRGVEISSELMDDPQISLIPQQVTSGVAVRMALLYLIGSGKF
ncbi:aspartate carbamoyltransferase catalytic subunit [Moorena sp. SIO4G3]|uniref:aspartate carbamoyltransferase catalytic subunit n=1 Tax=Moorena sp. SIO4G3 TaxID=2607821 RepID=UPI001429516D|nr:aspartate carbamoyltransferase catalytic subunit [Moorena sp. SIO4G3]NEO77279.1 aspartate carbamoyltransferase catalytic subunit [Moorena sp. SIO4G3]